MDTSTVTALGRRTPPQPPPLRDAPTLTPRPPDRRAGSEYYDGEGNFVGKPEPTCEEAAKPWLDDDCPCRHDYPDEKWCLDACALCAAREELWSLGVPDVVRGEWWTLEDDDDAGIYLGEDDFLFTVTVKPTGGEQGTILARHAAGVPKGWSLYIDGTDHLLLTIYGDGGVASTLQYGTPLTPGVEQVVTFERRGDVATLQVDGEDAEMYTEMDVRNWNDAAGVVSPDKLNLGALSTGELTFTGTLKNAKLEGGNKAGRACCSGDTSESSDQYTKCSSTDMAGKSCSSMYASMSGHSCINTCSEAETIGSVDYWACQCRPE